MSQPTNPVFEDAAMVIVPFRDTELDAELVPLQATASPQRNARAVALLNGDAETDEAPTPMTHWEAVRDLLMRMALFVAGGTAIGVLVVAYVRSLP